MNEGRGQLIQPQFGEGCLNAGPGSAMVLGARWSPDWPRCGVYSCVGLRQKCSISAVRRLAQRRRCVTMLHHDMSTAHCVHVACRADCVSLQT